VQPLSRARRGGGPPGVAAEGGRGAARTPEAFVACGRERPFPVEAAAGAQKTIKAARRDAMGTGASRRCALRGQSLRTSIAVAAATTQDPRQCEPSNKAHPRHRALADPMGAQRLASRHTRPSARPPREQAEDGRRRRLVTTSASSRSNMASAPNPSHSGRYAGRERITAVQHLDVGKRSRTTSGSGDESKTTMQRHVGCRPRPGTAAHGRAAGSGFARRCRGSPRSNADEADGPGCRERGTRAGRAGRQGSRPMLPRGTSPLGPRGALQAKPLEPGGAPPPHGLMRWLAVFASSALGRYVTVKPDGFCRLPRARVDECGGSPPASPPAADAVMEVARPRHGAR